MLVADSLRDVEAITGKCNGNGYRTGPVTDLTGLRT